MERKAFIERYSRQMLVPEVGLAGQEAISAGRVLIVGCGGLGCPVALYLAAAGVGTLRVCDADMVEPSNLPRQILHRESALGGGKASSIAASCAEINSTVKMEAMQLLVDSDNVFELMKGMDVVVDATDNVVTRYLLNDAAAVQKIPLVSGAALGWEGQLSVFTWKQQTSPCYRCLYPQPPPAEAVTNCDLGGVMGPVTGLIGSMQALQVLRILIGQQPACTDSLLTFSGVAADRPFRHLKLRHRNPDCWACGDQGVHRIYDQATMKLKLNYFHFCGGQGPDDKERPLNLLLNENRIGCQELKELLAQNCTSVVLIDVRPENQFKFCSIEGSVNFPFTSLSPTQLLNHLAQYPQASHLVFICRRGNDSQLAVQEFQGSLPPTLCVRDLVGGLRAWGRLVDSQMPIY